MVTIGIIGTRRRNSEDDFRAVEHAFYLLFNKYKDIQIISGGCVKGGDRFAEKLAYEMGIPITIYYPRKDKMISRQTAIRELFARNTLIVQDSDFLIACIAEDRKGGTEDAIKKFIKLGKGLNLYLV